MNNLKELYQEWSRVSKKRKDTGLFIGLPHYFLKTNTNDSLEKIANEIVSKLEEYELITFTTDIKKYVYYLSVPKEDNENFPSFKRFFEYHKKELSKFNIPYEGALFIDISEWVSKHTYNRNQFKDFLEFINVIKEGTMIFFVSERSHSDNLPVYQLIKSKIRIEQVEVQDDFTMEGVKFFKSLADSSDIKIEDKAVKALPEMISTILRVRGNRASESIYDIYNEILYQKSKNRSDTLKTINFNDIKDYLKDGKFEKDSNSSNAQSIL